MGMSKKAINKFTKFTATKPPAYKYKKPALNSIKKGSENKSISNPVLLEILKKKRGEI